MMESQSEADFRQSLKALRKRARAHLERCEVKGAPLLEFLAKDRQTLGNEFAIAVWKSEPVWRNVFPEAPFGHADTGKAYYLETLAGLAREARQMAAQQNGGR